MLTAEDGEHAHYTVRGRKTFPAKLGPHAIGMRNCNLVARLLFATHLIAGAIDGNPWNLPVSAEIDMMMHGINEDFQIFHEQRMPLCWPLNVASASKYRICLCFLCLAYDCSLVFMLIQNWTETIFPAPSWMLHASVCFPHWIYRFAIGYRQRCTFSMISVIFCSPFVLARKVYDEPHLPYSVWFSVSIDKQQTHSLNCGQRAADVYS